LELVDLSESEIDAEYHVKHDQNERVAGRVVKVTNNAIYVQTADQQVNSEARPLIKIDRSRIPKGAEILLNSITGFVPTPADGRDTARDRASEVRRRNSFG
jgi:hypothetical protein